MLIDPFNSKGVNRRSAMMGILELMVHEHLGGSIPIVGEK
jgi:hypothetical protein